MFGVADPQTQAEVTAEESARMLHQLSKAAVRTISLSVILEPQIGLLGLAAESWREWEVSLFVSCPTWGDAVAGGNSVQLVHGESSKSLQEQFQEQMDHSQPSRWLSTNAQSHLAHSIETVQVQLQGNPLLEFSGILLLSLGGSLMQLLPSILSIMCREMKPDASVSALYGKSNNQNQENRRKWGIWETWLRLMDKLDIVIKG